MTDKQREAIDRLKKYIEEDDFYNIYKEIKEDERKGKIGGTHIVFCKAIDIALSLIKAQQEEISKYKTLYERALSDVVKTDKQIDLMAEIFYKRFKAELLLEYGFESKEEIKQYFESRRC